MKNLKKNLKLRPPLQTESTRSSSISHHNEKPPEEPSLLQPVYLDKLRGHSSAGQVPPAFWGISERPRELLRHCVQSNHPTPPSKWQDIRVGLKGTRAQYTSIHPGRHHSPIHMSTGRGRRQLLISYLRPHRRDVSLGEHRGSGVGQDRVGGSSSSATALSHAQGPWCVQLCPSESTTQEMASRLKLLRSSLSIQS